MNVRAVSLQFRDHDDGNSAFLVFTSNDGHEEHLEWDFVLQALDLRERDSQAFEFVWSLIDAFEERGAPLDGLES